MRVDQAFSKAGFQILEAKRDGKTSLVMAVRVPLDHDIIPIRWKTMMEHVLVAAEHVASKPVTKWEVDIAKRFFSRNGSVRFLWRIHMKGDLAACQVALVTATLNSLRTGNELSEVPLIGTRPSGPDPASGKFKGAYPRNDDDRASQVVANAFSVGTG